MNPTTTLTAVIAAAGLSSRMGSFKPTLPVGEESICRRLISSFLEAGALPVTVVTGFMAETLEEHLKGLPVRLIHNASYSASEMFDSLCLGLSSLRAQDTALPDRIFLCPADMPLIRPETIALMARQTADIVVPVCDGRRGHPVCISRRILPHILNHDGADGLRGVLRTFHEETLFLPVPDSGILADTDTPEDYRKILKSCGEADQ